MAQQLMAQEVNLQRAIVEFVEEHKGETGCSQFGFSDQDLEEWLKKKGIQYSRSELVTTLNALIREGKLEIGGGGFYEPAEHRHLQGEPYCCIMFLAL